MAVIVGDIVEVRDSVLTKGQIVPGCYGPNVPWPPQSHKLFLHCIDPHFFLIVFAEGFVIMWKKGNDIITVNKQIVVPALRNRFQLQDVDNGNELVISLAEEDDASEWTCEVSSFKPIELKHSVKIRGRTHLYYKIGCSFTQKSSLGQNCSQLKT